MPLPWRSVVVLAALASFAGARGADTSGFVTFDDVRGQAYNVSYDGRRVGRRTSRAKR